MALFHYFEAITNTRGESLVGYFVRVINAATQAVVPIASDINGTPIQTVSGIANMAKTDQNGNISLYVEPSTYNLDIYQPDASTFLLRVPNIAMSSGPAGKTGASNNTRLDLAELKAADIADATSLYDGSLWTWTEGNFAGQADDINVVAADSTALTIGAWVRQQSNGIGFREAAANAVPITVEEALREAYLTPERFGAIGNPLLADDTIPIQRCIDAAIALGRPVAFRAFYKITNTIVVTNEITITGSGALCSGLNLYTSDPNMVALRVSCPNNASIIGLRLGGFGINCGGGTARGIGLRITTFPSTIEVPYPNSAISVSQFKDLRIVDVNVGVSMTGTIYMSTFRNITVTGQIDSYGWFVTTPTEIIYNSYTDLEVTGVGPAAYAYWCQASQSQFRNLTCDGCCYFSNPYGKIQGLTVEGIHAPTTPNSTLIQFNQAQEASGVAIINVPNAKCNIGISVIGYINLTAVRFPNAGVANQPATPIYFDPGARGMLSGVQMTGCVNRLSPAALAGMLAVACDDITDFSFSYMAEGTWTPGFATWTAAPTISAATYSKVGREVSVSIIAQGGNAPDEATITGLPVPIATMFGGAGLLRSSSDRTLSSAFSALPGESKLSALSPVDLTGETWHLSYTYRS